MRWEIIKRTGYERLLIDVQRLKKNEVLLVTTNGTERLRVLQATILHMARKRGVKIMTHAVSSNRLEVLLAAS